MHLRTHVRGFRRQRLIALPFVLLAALATGPMPAMPALSQEHLAPPPQTIEVPLRFVRHNFSAYCYNTLKCSVVYDNNDFTRLDNDSPSFKPSATDNYKSRWDASYLGIRNFPPPAKVKWTSLDGQPHEAQVDISHLFREQLIWHKVPKSDMADFFEGPVAGEAGILLEVNDRTASVYTKTFIPTRSEQIPGNKNSNFRDDLFLAWTQTY